MEAKPNHALKQCTRNCLPCMKIFLNGCPICCRARKALQCILLQDCSWQWSEMLCECPPCWIWFAALTRHSISSQWFGSLADVTRLAHKGIVRNPTLSIVLQSSIDKALLDTQVSLLKMKDRNVIFDTARDGASRHKGKFVYKHPTTI